MRHEQGSIPVVSVEELADQYGINRRLVPASPHMDVKRLLTVMSEEGVMFERSKETLQIKGVELVKSASERIAAAFSSQLGEERLWLLQTIYEGVVIIKNFDNAIPRVQNMIDLPSNPLFDLFLIGEKLRMIVDVEGLVVKPYNSILLSEGIFDEKTSEVESREIAVHEVWHVLSDNELPMLLNEAATDTYTVKTLGGGQRSDRMLFNYKLAYRIWQEVEKLAGAEMAMEGYLERGIREETYIPATGEIIANRIVDIELHDFMREIFGQNAKGEAYWDAILDKIDKKNLIKATALFFTRKFLTRKSQMTG